MAARFRYIAVRDQTARADTQYDLAPPLKPLKQGIGRVVSFLDLEQLVVGNARWPWKASVRYRLRSCAEDGWYLPTNPACPFALYCAPFAILGREKARSPYDIAASCFVQIGMTARLGDSAHRGATDRVYRKLEPRRPLPSFGECPGRIIIGSRPTAGIVFGYGDRRFSGCRRNWRCRNKRRRWRVNDRNRCDSLGGGKWSGCCNCSAEQKPVGHRADFLRKRCFICIESNSNC